MGTGRIKCPAFKFRISGWGTSAGGYIIFGTKRTDHRDYGPVACGKSTLGKAFLCEYPYEGKIQFAGRELQDMKEQERTGIAGYLGHDPELFL